MAHGAALLGDGAKRVQRGSCLVFKGRRLNEERQCTNDPYRCDVVYQRDIGKYFFVNRTIKLWNQLPAEARAAFSCKSLIFRMRIRELDIVGSVYHLVIYTIHNVVLMSKL